MPLPRIPKSGASGETARLMLSQFNITTPPGMVIKQSPTGTEWRDDRHKPFPAKITGDGSGSGGGPSGSGWADFDHHYDWIEVVPRTINSEVTFEEKENGRFGTSMKRPLVEANGVTDVPVDAIVMAYPGPTLGMEPEWYYFWWSGSIGSGSGNSIPAYCDGVLSGYITIDGDSVSFESVD